MSRPEGASKDRRRVSRSRQHLPRAAFRRLPARLFSSRRRAYPGKRAKSTTPGGMRSSRGRQRPPLHGTSVQKSLVRPICRSSSSRKAARRRGVLARGAWNRATVDTRFRVAESTGSGLTRSRILAGEPVHDIARRKPLTDLHRCREQRRRPTGSNGADSTAERSTRFSIVATGSARASAWLCCSAG
jgi:hypothetical protein